MSELALTISLIIAAVFIYVRYRNAFSLPFFWTAYFLCQYVGFLQLRGRYGGSSYAYAAAAFGAFVAGLLTADLIPHLSSITTVRKRSRGARERSRQKGEIKPAQKSIGTRQEGDTKPEQKSIGTRLDLIFPVLPLNVGLFMSLAFALILSCIFFADRGVPVLSSSPALAWVQSTSGVVNRLMTVFGPGCYVNLGLLALAVHRETGSRAARAMTYAAIGMAILAQALLASKAAAIMIFLSFNIILFYLDKKRDLRKSLLPLILVVVPVSAAVVAVRLASTQGYWEAGGIYETYYSRLTTATAEPENFIFNYSNRFGPMHGAALRLEAHRIKEQLTGATKTPILSEFIYDLLNGLPTQETGLSATLTIGGVGYVEWGFTGLFLYSFAQGLGFGWIHRRLMRQKKMNLVSLLLWGSAISCAVSVSTSGSILVGLEGVALAVLPPLLLLLPFSLFFLLPMARRYRNTGGRTISRFPPLQVQSDRGAER